MSETMGRCRSEVDDCYGGLPLVAIADAIDRLAADVEAIKAAILPQTTEERDAAIRERDEARALLELAQVQRTAAYADRDEARAEVYRLKCSMTETSKERDAAIRERDEARAEVERLNAELAARRSMAPVVEVPAMPLEVGDANTHAGQYLRGRRDVAVSYRAALDKAGVKWKVVGRE